MELAPPSCRPDVMGSQGKAGEGAANGGDARDTGLRAHALPDPPLLVERGKRAALYVCIYILKNPQSSHRRLGRNRSG